MNRRKFLEKSTLALGGAYLGLHLTPLVFSSQKTPPSLVIIRNGKPVEMVRKAFEMLGSISKFVNRGDIVLVKPNISWDRTPRFAATTNPEIVTEVIRLCYIAGAKKVIIVDRTCNDARRCYKNSGIQEAASEAGAYVRFARDNHFKKVQIPNGREITSWSFHQDALKADKLINIPILKHHSISGGLTMGFKNMMGLLGGNRGRLHRSFHEKIVDINRVLIPQLTIIDAVRILRNNGPSGGNLDDVVQMNTIIVGTDRVLVDAWGAKIFGMDPLSFQYLRIANQEGMGEIDTEKSKPAAYNFSA